MTNPAPKPKGNDFVMLVAIVVMLVAMGVICYIAFHMASAVQAVSDAPPVNSPDYQCAQRGGIWVKPYKTPGKCFSKEAFK